MCLLGSKYAKNAFAAGAPPRNPLEELTALPRDPSKICGALRGGEGNGRARKGREGKKEDGGAEMAGEGKGP